MKVFKIILLTLLAAVTAVYGFTAVQEKASGRNIGPTLSCPSEVLELSVNDGNDVLLAGVTASDKQDGDLTSHILIQGKSRQITDSMTEITYLVFDSDGNSASATRSIRYTDYESPKFAINQSLVYSSAVSIALLDRISALDCINGDITSYIRVGSSLASTGDPEIYTVDVQVTNSLSDTSRLTLPVVVYSSTSVHPVIKLTEYLIYLGQGSAFNAKSYLSSVESPRGEILSTADVTIEGSVNTAVPGTYMIYYRYPYEGTTALAVLTVVVQ